MKLNYSIRLFNPSDINPKLKSDLNKLVGRSLRADFPDRDIEEIKGLVARTDKTRRNPNIAVDGVALRRKQSFSRVLGVALMSKDIPLMYVTTADNASSKHSGFVGIAERYAKLRLVDAFDKDWIKHRYRWLGLCSIDPSLRSVEDQSELKINSPCQKFMEAVVKTAHLEQPLSVYPAQEELLFKSLLVRNGFESDGIEPSPSQMFGSDTKPVMLEHWLA